MSSEKDISLEEMFSEIEKVIEELGDPDIAIESAFEKYENGMKLLKDCNDKIDMVEKKVMALNKDGDLDEF